MSTAIYLRVSSLKGQKTDSQRAALEAWLRRHHYQAVQWFEDHESGTTMQRAAFQRLQTAIFAGEVTTVVVLFWLTVSVTAPGRPVSLLT